MSITASEALSPLGESRSFTPGKRLSRLAWMVFTLMKERFQGGTNQEFDSVESMDLIEALRACSLYTDQIGCLNFEESLVIQVEGIDGHDYILQFSLFGPGLSVHAARVRITKLSLLTGQDGNEDSSFNTMNVLEQYSRRLELGSETIDRAFLVGMSLIIAFIDRPEDDPGEDARLAPLIRQVMPTPDELREIRAKLSSSSTNYDEEGDQPY